MNERIQDLIAQCTSTTRFSYEGRGGGYDAEYFNKAKFAELIVKECAKVAEDFVTVENNKLVENVYISPWRLQDNIKEHFGVE